MPWSVLRRGFRAAPADADSRTRWGDWWWSPEGNDWCWCTPWALSDATWSCRRSRGDTAAGWDSGSNGGSFASTRVGTASVDRCSFHLAKGRETFIISTCITHLLSFAENSFITQFYFEYMCNFRRAISPPRVCQIYLQFRKQPNLLNNYSITGVFLHANVERARINEKKWQTWSLVYLPLNISETRLARVGFLFRASFFSMIPDIICDISTRFSKSSFLFAITEQSSK